MNPTQETLDPEAVNLAKAIRHTESGDNFNARGKSGEYGAYQYTPDTWNKDAKTFLGRDVPLEQADKVTQNEVAYKKIKSLKDQGYNVGQIASIWNSGKPEWQGNVGINKFGVKYDTPGYVDSVAKTYQSFKQGNQNPTVTPNASTVGSDPIVKPQGGPVAPYSPDDSPLKTGVKALINTPGSALKFAKGVVSSMNPFNVLKGVKQVGSEFSGLAREEGTGKALLDTFKGIPKAAIDTLIPQGVRQIATGDLAGATKSFTEDPFGQTAPVVLALEGGAKLADKVASKNAMANYVDNIADNTKNRVKIPEPVTKYSDAFGKGAETIASPVTKPIGAISGKIAGNAGSVAASLASHITGLEPQTIRQILSDPAEFKKIQQDNVSRGGLAGEVESAINTRLEDLKETGTGYDAIRKSNQTVVMPEGMIEKALSDHGLKVRSEKYTSTKPSIPLKEMTPGELPTIEYDSALVKRKTPSTPNRAKIVADTNSITRNTADINAIQKFYDNWGKKKQLTPNEFLNMRSDLAELSKFDKVTGMGKTKASEIVGKSLYERVNRTIRDTQLEELKALDDTYAPEVDFLKKVKKDYFNPDGTFKDNAPSRIANAGNKVELLKRLENVIPGVTKRIEVLKAVEDIERASGVKVGTYGRLLAGGAGFATGGIVGLIVSEILTSPQLAVPILRKAGYLGSRAAPIIHTLKVLAGDVPKGSLIGGVNQDASKSRYIGLLPLRKTQSSTQP